MGRRGHEGRTRAAGTSSFAAAHGTCVLICPDARTPDTSCCLCQGFVNVKEQGRSACFAHSPRLSCIGGAEGVKRRLRCPFQRIVIAIQVRSYAVFGPLLCHPYTKGFFNALLAPHLFFRKFNFYTVITAFFVILCCAIIRVQNQFISSLTTVPGTAPGERSFFFLRHHARRALGVGEHLAGNAQALRHALKLHIVKLPVFIAPLKISVSSRINPGPCRQVFHRHVAPQSLESDHCKYFRSPPVSVCILPHSCGYRQR